MLQRIDPALLHWHHFRLGLESSGRAERSEAVAFDLDHKVVSAKHIPALTCHGHCEFSIV